METPPLPKSLAMKQYEASPAYSCQVSESENAYVITLRNTRGENAFEIKVNINQYDAEGVANRIKNRMDALISSNATKDLNLKQIKVAIKDMNLPVTVPVKEVSQSFFSKLSKKVGLHKEASPAKSSGHDKERLQEIALDILFNICDPMTYEQPKDKIEGLFKSFNKLYTFTPQSECINLLRHLEDDHLKKIKEYATEYHCTPLLVLLKQHKPYAADEDQYHAFYSPEEEEEGVAHIKYGDGRESVSKTEAAQESPTASEVQQHLLIEMCRLAEDAPEAELERVISQFNKFDTVEMDTHAISKIFEDISMVGFNRMKKCANKCHILLEIIKDYEGH